MGQAAWRAIAELLIDPPAFPHQGGWFNLISPHFHPHLQYSLVRSGHVNRDRHPLVLH